MKFKIEKDIPLPGVVNSTQYPLKSMDIGDSFHVDCVGRAEKTKVRMHLYRIKRIKFPDIEIVTKQEENGIRVWRTK
jgi:hypothetical protein